MAIEAPGVKSLGGDFGNEKCLLFNRLILLI
jgi:hypothetical protein